MADDSGRSALRYAYLSVGYSGQAVGGGSGLPAANRSQKAEGRRQKTEGRGQKTETEDKLSVGERSPTAN